MGVGYYGYWAPPEAQWRGVTGSSSVPSAVAAAWTWDADRTPEPDIARSSPPHRIRSDRTAGVLFWLIMKSDKIRVPVVDLFAGPGGLGEGFASLDDPDLEFQIVLSVEKDAAAYRTLVLRSFFRQFRREDVPPEYYAYLRGELSWDGLLNRFPMERDRALASSLRKELGTADDTEICAGIGNRLRGCRGVWVLIGGPPCQAYSIVGRSRMAKRPRREFESDVRHYLYRCYLSILARFSPAVFVMENVKGLVSCRVNGDWMFHRILSDLSAPGAALADGRDFGRSGTAVRYRIFPADNAESDLVEWRAYDFVMRAEDHGVPQRRHRVVLVGVRSDVKHANLLIRDSQQETPTVLEVLDDLPRLRSRLSREADSAERWKSALEEAWREGLCHHPDRRLRSIARDAIAAAAERSDAGGRFVKGLGRSRMRRQLREWYLDENLKGACNHESRPHRRDDLARYLFVSCFGLAHGRTPKLRDFPESLLPDHRNAWQARNTNELFDDRFRVQVGYAPATTVTAHISKDGHYYIHHDPSQCRSWTVREAARIQTFPDNYFFEGTRTEQYVQVGNAVPPLMARAIARRVAEIIRQGILRG